MEEKKHEVQHRSRKSLTDKLRKNPWILSTVILTIFALLLMVGGIPSGSAISKDAAAQIILDFAKEQTGQELELDSVVEMSGLYEVTIIYQDQSVPLYLTKDGKSLVQGLTPLSSLNPEPQESTSTDVPKSDKPKVELFIMTHCPYGTQAEKGFIPAVLELGDSIDASIKFVHYFMHDPEKTETPIQVCIREEQSDKFDAYLKCFLEDGDSDRCISEIGIDSNALNDCISNEADGYYDADSALSEGYGVGGSPTLVINGVKISSGRSPDAFLKTICSTFNDAPDVCSTAELDDASPSPGFGYGTTSGIANAQC